VSTKSPGRNWILGFLENFYSSVLTCSLSNVREFFEGVSRILSQALGARLVCVWDYNRFGNCLVLQAACPEVELPDRTYTIGVDSWLTGPGTEKIEVQFFEDLRQTGGRRSFQNATVIDALGLKQAISIPVFRPSDSSAPAFVVDSFFIDESLPGVPKHDRRSLDLFKSTMGRSLDYLLYRIEHDVRGFVANKTVSASGVSGLFDALFPEVQRHIRCRRSTMFRVETAEKRLVLEQSAGVSGFKLGGQNTDFAEWIHEECVLKNRSVMRTDSLSAGEGEKWQRWSVIATPILSSSNEALGVLVCDEPDPGQSFSSFDLTILEGFARAMGPVAERFLRTREGSPLTEALNVVASELARAAGIDDVAQRAIESVTASLNAEVGSVYLFENGPEQVPSIRLHAGTGAYRKLVGTAQYSVDEGLTGHIATGKTVNFKTWDECRGHPSWKGKFDAVLWEDERRRQSDTLLGLPIKMDDRIIGVLKLENIRPSDRHVDPYFTDEDVEIARALCSLLAYAIEHHKYKALMSNQFRVLAKSLVQIEKARTDDDAIVAVMSALEEAGWSNAMLSLYDPATKQVSGIIGSGKFNSEVVNMTKRDIGSSDVLALSLRENRAVFIPDSANDNRCDQKAVTAGKIKAQYVLPLRLEDEWIGTMQVDFGSRTKIEQDEELILQAFATHMAVAVSRIRKIHESLDQTTAVLRRSRFIVAEALSALAVHQTNRALENILRQLREDLKKQEIREREKLLKPLETWRDRLEKAQKDLGKVLNIVRAPGEKESPCPDAHALIQEVIDTWIAYIRQKKCGVQLRLEAKDTTCSIGAQQFKEILSVLLVNALQAFSKKIDVRTYNDNNVDCGKNFIESAFCMECSDDGQGLSTNNLEEIFKPTYTTKHENFGTGLGLYMARLLAHNAGGDLVVLDPSQKSRGVTFRLTLPSGQEA
jgi:signal transduction histidine kinase